MTEAQKTIITGWIREGLKLADIQKRMQAELGLGLTYMEVRLLVDDLKLVPKDVEVPAAPVLPTAPPAAQPPNYTAPAGSSYPPGTPGLGQLPSNPMPSQPFGAPPESAGVQLGIDQVTRPGMLASGTVRFSDGQSAKWYLDQMGRLGMAPDTKGYRPAPADVEEFLLALERELSRLGM